MKNTTVFLFFSGMSKEKLDELQPSLRSLGQEKPFTVMEVKKIKSLTSKFGAVVEVSFAKTDPETGTRSEMNKTLLSAHLAERVSLEPRSILIYYGKVKLGGNRECFELKRVNGDVKYKNATELKAAADELRAMTKDQLRMYRVIRSLTEFPENSTFVVSSYRKSVDSSAKSKKDKGQKSSFIATYNFSNAETTKIPARGEVFLPERLFEKCDPDTKFPGIIIYKGLKASTKNPGREYCDVQLYNVDEMRSIFNGIGDASSSSSPSASSSSTFTPPPPPAEAADV